jgi:hypothetical protein
LIGLPCLNARDDRPWCGPDPPAAVNLYSPDRRAERPATHLKRFEGTVQVDCYPGFERLLSVKSTLPRPNTICIAVQAALAIS